MKAKKIIIALVLLALIGAFVWLAVPTFSDLSQKAEENTQFEELRDSVKRLATTETTPAGTIVEIPESVDMNALHTNNPDVWGWISVPGTAIDYPVVYTPDNPQKYLHTNLYGEYSFSGVPFLSEKPNGGYIVYGHRMKNGTMFADVGKFLDEAFAKTHEVVYLYTAEGKQEYRAVCCTVIRSDNEWYADGELKNLLASASVVLREGDISDTDTLTLSTCRDATGPWRIVLVCERIQ